MRPVRWEAVYSLWSRLSCGPLKMRRVPQEAFLSTARIFRTVKACFWYRVLSHRGRLPPQRSLAYILVDLFLLVSVYDYRFGIGIELLFRFVERLQKRVSGALVSNGGGRTVSRVHLYRWVEKYDLFHY